MIAALLLLALDGGAELPRARVDASYPVTSGRTLAVPPGASLQAALDRARPGDEVVLEAGAVYRGPFRLPRKPGAGWIVVRGSALARLPSPGTRVAAADAPRMPKLEASVGAVLSAEPGAHHYRLVGLEIRPVAGTFLYNLVMLGEDEGSLELQPHHLVVDRCWIHGDPKRGSRRGIALGSRDTAVSDSWISDIKEVGADSQAVAGWSGAGPFLLQNNLLEAAGENVMFGGADPRIAGLVPSDIEIRRNHFRKPLAWKADEARFEGTKWSVKNLFELKNARRVRVSGNLFEHNWVAAQNGFAILLTVRNQDGRAPWSSVEDVTFENNVVRRSAAGVNVLGRDDNAPSGPAARIRIRNNLFEDVGHPRWGPGASGRLFQLLQAPRDVVIEHNTALHRGPALVFDGPPLLGFVFRHNVVVHNGEAVVRRESFGDGVFRNNVIVGGGPAAYPEPNQFPKGLAGVGFADPDGGDYRLRPGSAFRGAASDGRDIGADFDALERALGAGEQPADAAGVRSAQFFLWLSFLLLAYANLGYPALLALWAALRPRPFRSGGEAPTATILVAAHNEADTIAARLNNLLTLDYPPQRLSIALGLDGCDDATAERARLYAAAGVRVVEYGERRGKPSVLNALAAGARSEILVFADARQRFEPGALRALVAPFADPEVGAVSGELLLLDGEGKPLERGLGLYWRCEKAIRRAESRVGSVVGATGAIYAVRRRLFEAFPPDTILDDVWLPMRIARAGRRVVFEPGARAWDRPPASAGVEFTRKVRTIAGVFQLFAREPWLLGAKNPLWLQTLSHKALRLLTPLLMLVALFANLMLLHAPGYRLLLLLQLAFYAAALLGHLSRGPRIPGLSVPYTVCLLAWATVVAFAGFVTGRQRVTWARPARRPA
jgi:cellulose synthase/poly-beta-1,6-N-acetylglucosamine synthase-like glycosyltransferase